MVTSITDPAEISRALLIASGASFVVACSLALGAVFLVRAIIAKPRLRHIRAAATLVLLIVIFWVGFVVFFEAIDAQLDFGNAVSSSRAVFVDPGPLHKFAPITGAVITWVTASLFLRRRDRRSGSAA